MDGYFGERERGGKKMFGSSQLRMNSHLESVICPTTEFHDAGLFVKWEILYIDFATRFVDGRRFPLDQPVAVDGGFGRQRHLEVSIRTTHTHTHT